VKRWSIKMMDIKELISKVKEVTNTGLPFMTGLEKAEIGMGEIMHINNYGYLKGEEGDFVVFTTKEYPKNFFFGSSVLTGKMKELDIALGEENMFKLLDNGIEVVFDKKKSKNKREYTNCVFFPSHQ